MATNKAVVSRPDSTLQRYDADKTRAEFIARLEAIPEPASDDGGLSMVADILSADTWEDLIGDQSGLPKAELVSGKEMLFHSIERHDSTLPDSPLPYFLVVTCTSLETGEVIRFQTSATTIVAKLVKMAEFGAFPFVGSMHKSTKPTRAGYYPMNLNILARDAS